MKVYVYNKLNVGFPSWLIKATIFWFIHFWFNNCKFIKYYASNFSLKKCLTLIWLLRIVDTNQQQVTAGSSFVSSQILKGFAPHRFEDRRLFLQRHYFPPQKHNNEEDQISFLYRQVSRSLIIPELDKRWLRKNGEQRCSLLYALFAWFTTKIGKNRSLFCHKNPTYTRKLVYL